jgi:cytochrome c oxidase assembly protein subunit 11
MTRRNRLTLGLLVGVPVTMIALSFAAVPLYSVFCRATGFGGTTQRAAQGADRVIDRTIEIRFNTDVNSELPWDFRPNQRSITVKIGETGIATFHAHNRGAIPIVGTAVYNVTPEKAGLYFDKIQCFCFTQQVLKPQESADLPVAFFVDPAIVKDRNLDDVSVITLSYTFYKAQSQAFERAVDSGDSAPPAAKTPAAAVQAPAALAGKSRVD